MAGPLNETEVLTSPHSSIWGTSDHLFFVFLQHMPLFYLCTSNTSVHLFVFLKPLEKWAGFLSFHHMPNTKHSAYSTAGIHRNFLSPKLLIHIPNYHCLPPSASHWHFKLNMFKIRLVSLPLVPSPQPCLWCCVYLCVWRVWAVSGSL